ncbi:MAG: hypothetical protein PHT69_08505 [Bacteroidales bacterium]|nr:hypothetical protein [Bacteroidales bacterium]
MSCFHCNHSFWLNKLKPINAFEPFDELPLKYANLAHPFFADIDAYFNALYSDLCENLNEEFFIRINIWWSYNDRLRANRNMFIDDNDKLDWLNNTKKFIDLLNPNNSSHKMMRAELHRNLGNFDKSLEILNTIHLKKYDKLKKAMINECYNKNNLLFKL